MNKIKNGLAVIGAINVVAFGVMLAGSYNEKLGAAIENGAKTLGFTLKLKGD